MSARHRGLGPTAVLTLDRPAHLGGRHAQPAARRAVVHVLAAVLVIAGSFTVGVTVTVLAWVVAMSAAPTVPIPVTLALIAVAALGLAGIVWFGWGRR